MSPENLEELAYYQQLTPFGNGGISTFLIHDKNINHFITKYFTGFNPKKREYKIGCFYYGKLLNQKNELIDEIILSIHSEHKIEIHSHGGRTSAKLIIEFLESIGYKKSDNNHLDQNSKNTYYQQALNDLQTSREYQYLKNQMNLYSEIQKKMNRLTQSEIETILINMINNFEIENKNRQRMHICLCGLPNAGKSSLLNSITGKKRAIVSNIERTTRDTVTENLQLLGHHIHLSDTAGLHQSDNQLDHESVAQAYKNINQADLLLWLHDQTKIFDQAETAYINKIKEGTPNKKMILCLTKSDLPSIVSKFEYPLHFEKVFKISSAQNNGIEEMLEHIIAMLFPSANNTSGIAALSQKMSNDIRLSLNQINQKVDLQADKFTMYKKTLEGFLSTIPQV